MKNVLILGAGGQIARWVIQLLAGDSNIRLTLFLRNARRLAGENAHVVEGDVLDRSSLDAAMTGQEVVYANLTGDDIDAQAQSVIASMKAAGVKRLVFVTSLGIYDEVPGAFGEWNRREIGEYLPPFRRAADTIEASGLAYTILRPAWLSDVDEVDYAITARNQPFGGTEVSRKSVAALIAKIIASPGLHVGGNLGVHKPGSDGEKPSFL
ncbi:SDR family oxidoreductase [Myxococcus xanthus]|uniref:SDR family oxidoreductase n=1 Tax=Myxococcus xanthus TaxID=34 RepID=A0A7Y4IJQ1_MYXXA|nr:SDR family oxidoreductase [Myxococcus xanthus]NOJ80391.1 SDR family oxidoreductase [Myxococcus xanthus]NOJ84924.1 SDR family oxidoreductase [Myxococcus xanthus]